jgi:nucleoside-diphosphate-sugar epimerase
VLHAKKPFRVPAFIAKRVAGELPVHWSTAMPGVSNAKAKRELGWEPRYRSFREGSRR